MDRFQEMHIFTTVAQEQGFSSAARRLGLSAASVTRAVAALELRIGTQLLIRTTRSVHLSEAGQRYLEDCRRILAEVQEAEDSAAGSHAQPRGQLTVTAPVLFGDLFVTPVMAGYLAQYPEVTINAVLVDRIVNMVEEGIDVAVRIGDLPDSSQHAIRVGEVRRVICGSPDYFARHGRPIHPHALAGVPVVAFAVGGIPDVLQDRHNGLLAAPTDTAALARQLDTLLAEPKLAAQLRDNARRTQQERYDLKALAERWSQLYIQTAGETRA